MQGRIVRYIALHIVLLVTLLYPQTLKIAFSYDKPPYTFAKDTHKGIEPALVKKILEPYGYQVDILQMNKYYLRQMLLNQNDIDGVSAVTPTTNGNIFYSHNFSFYENYVITRKRDHIKIDKLDDLKNIDFVSWSSSYNDLGKQFNSMFNPKTGTYKEKYHENPSQMEDVRMFLDGKADALLIDKNIFRWYTTYFNVHDEFEYHRIFSHKNGYCMGFRSRKVRDEFDRGLDRIIRNGEYQRIMEYYLTHDMTSIIKMATVLGEIVAPYLYRLDHKLSDAILERFATNSNIVSIEIIDTKLNKVFAQSTYSLPSGETDMLSVPIRYRRGGTDINLGVLKIVYNKNFDFGHKIPVPAIEILNDIPGLDTEMVRSIYKQNSVIITKPLHLTDEEKAYIKHKKSISVHNEKLWAPYNFNIDGEPQGFVVDYMRLLGRMLNLKIEFVSGYSWNEFLQLIREERIDVISNIVNTPDRAKYINFTTTYMTSKKAIFSNQPGLKHFVDLSGKRVAVPKGFYIERFIEHKYPSIKLKTYKNVLACIVAVLNGEADAVVESYSVINYL